MELYLETFGFTNPTIVKYYNTNLNRWETVQSYRLDVHDTVELWKRCFGYNALFDRIVLKCPKKLFNSLRQSTFANVKSVIELLEEQGVKPVEDDNVNWF